MPILRWNAPDREFDALEIKRSLPGENVLIDAVDQDAIEVVKQKASSFAPVESPLGEKTPRKAGRQTWLARLRGINSSRSLKEPSQLRAVDDSIMYHESSGARMRGAFADQGGWFSYISPEARVPANHLLRKVRELVRDVLSELNGRLGKLYASEGRPSIPPEQLLSALLLQVFYGIRSERQLMEQLDYNLLYRWFVGLSPDDPVWDPTPSLRTATGCRTARCLRSS